MEAIGLAGFVIGAGLLSILLEHPDLPVMRSTLGKYPIMRRIPMALALGGYITVVVLLIGEISGAHINPSVTWTYFRLGKISFTNACFYTIAQFGGAMAGVLLLKLSVGKWFAHPVINYGNSAPMPPHHAMSAFAAEFIISFILMLSVLIAASFKRFAKYGALIAGTLIALFIIIEMPFSGMSLNPARSFAASFASNSWNYLWIYFVAPTLAMLTAAEVFLQLKKQWLFHHKKQFNDMRHINYIHSACREIPVYPKEHESKRWNGK